MAKTTPIQTGRTYRRMGREVTVTEVTSKYVYYTSSDGRSHRVKYDHFRKGHVMKTPRPGSKA